jgi:hypothetical protein
VNCKHGHDLTPENIYVTAKGVKECRECREAWRKKYRQNNRDKERKRNRRFYAENKEQIRQRYLKNREKRLEQMRQYQKENYPRLLEYWRQYHKEHPEPGREKCRRRRARKLGQVGKFDLWMVRYYRYAQENKCCYCGEQMRKGVRNGDPCKETLEHIIPLSKGGLHCWTNTSLACWRCNCRKQDKAEVSV